MIRRTAGPVYTGEELGHTHADLGIRIDHNTAATRWRGERMDYELGVWILCQRVERARRIRDRGVSGASCVSNGSKNSNNSNVPNIPDVPNVPNVPNDSDVSAETSDKVAETGRAADKRYATDAG